MPCSTVYPRVYGETGDYEQDIRLLMGLSPRVRGNLTLHTNASSAKGSIPACTGKPPENPCQSRKQQVYPRVYGETSGSL